MRRCSATLVLAVLACNAGDRGQGPLSGSAGLSAGESAGTSGSMTTGISGADTSESAPETSGGDPTSSSGGSADEAESAGSSGGSESGAAQTEDTSSTSASASSSESSSGGELADGILDITIVAHDDCTFTVTPSSITVPEGTEFTVNWISSGSSEIEFDIAKIDEFNQVPIILGMEPATSYHDEVREWCGDLFTGTFDFRLTSCFDDHYIPVDCGG